MKKLLAFVLAMIMLVSFAGCGITENKEFEESEMPNVVGIWQLEDAVYGGSYNKEYLYIYEDATGDTYFTFDDDVLYGKHYNNFVWNIEDNYFVIESFGNVRKYKIEGDNMYDKQKKLFAVKVSEDTTIDIEITAD